MANELVITFEGDHIQVLSDGAKDFEFSTRLWTGVVGACEENDCFNVLGIANTTKPLETMEAFDHGKLFQELGISRKYRIAWVEQNPKGYDAAHLVESVLYNRGFLARLFPNVEQARKWLRSGVES